MNYVRVSDAVQVKGAGLENQLLINNQAIDRLMAQDPMFTRIDDIVEAGVSAFKGNNLQEVLENSKLGKYPEGSTVVMFDQTRFSREGFFEASIKIREIAMAGMFVHFSTTGQTIGEDDVSDFGRFIGLQAGFEAAHKESKSKSDRTRASYQGKMSRGDLVTIGTMPAWIRKVYDSNFTPPKVVGIEAIPERAKVLQQIFKLYIDGWGTNKIVAWLNENVEVWPENHRRVANVIKNKNKLLEAKGERAIEKNAFRWTESYITRILQDRRLLGERIFNINETDKRNETKTVETKVVKGAYPVIIDNDHFQRAIGIRSSRGGKKTMRKYPPIFVTPVCRCGYCGGRIAAQQYEHMSAGFRCARKAKGEEISCHGGSHKARWLEQVVIELCSDQINFDTVFGVDTTIDTYVLGEKIDNLREEKSDCDGRLTKLEDLYLDGAITKERFILRKYGIDERVDEITTEMRFLNETINSVGTKANPDDFIALLNEAKAGEISTETRLKLRDLVPQFVERIDIYSYGTSIKTNEQWEAYKATIDSELADYIWEHNNPLKKDKNKLTYNIIFKNGQSRAIFFDRKKEDWSFTATIDGGVANLK